ncbi:hypothetical protein MYBA111488_00640 [Mycobacterium basiliense]
MNCVGALLRPHCTGQRDLGQHRANRPIRDVRRPQTGEGRAILNAVLVEPQPQLFAVLGARMGGHQTRDVVGRRLVLIVGGVQHSPTTPDRATLLEGLHHEVDNTR